MTTKLFRNARINTPVSNSSRTAEKKGSYSISFWECGAVLVKNGLIERIGDETEVLKGLSHKQVDQEITCEGRCLVPGFVDPHTHMCFSSPREAEFSKRLAGTPYLEMLKAGGGILSSVRSVRESTDEVLLGATRKNVMTALLHGTTTVEIKSGYGLDTKSEIRMLKVIEQIGRETPLDIVSTFMGAHAVPMEYKGDSDGYVDLIVNEMIPAVSRECGSAFCDVFCEEGVFSVPQSRRILLAAKEHGMASKIHADEVNDTGGAALAAEIGAVSAEHLLATNDTNLAAMAKAGVIAVLLPATAYSLRKPPANARRMMELGLTVALSTDCNPGSSFTQSMPFVFSLAVMNMMMTVNEALAACTLNAARAIRMDSIVGSLEKRKYADFLILDGETPAILAYQTGVPPIYSIFKRGECMADCFQERRTVR
ncbi:MAG: imidazolonepropionase [Thermovirgaceae bacterium]|nr:imidazolonepropionase [Thermovirgaceae bacterium]